MDRTACGDTIGYRTSPRLVQTLGEQAGIIHRARFKAALPLSRSWRSLYHRHGSLRPETSVLAGISMEESSVAEQSSPAI